MEIIEKQNLSTDLTKDQLYALLQTIIEDKHAIIKKLEIRRKANGSYRVVTNIEQNKAG